MSTETQQPTGNSYDTAVSIIGAIFGTAHFVLQSAADLTAHAEGKLVEKISKGEIKAIERTQFRKDQTLVKQDKAIEAIKNYRAKLQAKAQGNADMKLAS